LYRVNGGRFVGGFLGVFGNGEQGQGGHDGKRTNCGKHTFLHGMIP
jgi:hypothetical protein